MSPLRRLRRPSTSLLAALVVSWLAVAAGLPSSASAAPGAREAAGTGQVAGRAMWVWTQPAAKTLVGFARQHQVMDLFLAVPPNLPSSSALTWVRSVDKAARGTGIRLHALGGDPGWLDNPAAAVDWATAATSTGLFTGVHVDVEPWLHPGWDTDRAGTVGRYLSVLDRLRQAVTLPLEADVAFWLHTVSAASGRPLDAEVLDRVDRVTVMSYRDTATGVDSITDVAATTLATARAAGKPARLAVETNYLGDDAVAAKQTFYGQTATEMEAVMAAVDVASSESAGAGYAGIGVHDYAGWTALRP